MTGSRSIITPHRSVLIVDDEEHVRAGLARVLERDGYATLTAETGEEALAMMGDRAIHIVISDFNMPGCGGIELFKRLRQSHPHVLRILLTGEDDPELPVRAINEAEVYRFIRKPWNNQDLRTILRLAFDVVLLEEEKRKLLAIVRRLRASGKGGISPTEEELLLLAEADILGD